MGFWASRCQGSSRFRATEAALRAAREARPQLGPQLRADRGWLPIGGFRGVVPPGETAGHGEGA
jgi:hypothetical protein